jgi:hypothetical protein
MDSHNGDWAAFIVPIYDCRNTEVDLNRDLEHLDRFPCWTEEIPTSSFVVVSYTVAVFCTDRTGVWSVSFNIHWAMIYGISDHPVRF